MLSLRLLLPLVAVFVFGVVAAPVKPAPTITQISLPTHTVSCHGPCRSFHDFASNGEKLILDTLVIVTTLIERDGATNQERGFVCPL